MKNTIRWIINDFKSYPFRFCIEFLAWCISIGCSITMAATVPNPPFITGGIIVTDSLSKLGFYADRSQYQYFGIGFEYRKASGLLVRGSIYCLQVEEFFLLWPGVHIGYAF